MRLLLMIQHQMTPLSQTHLPVALRVLVNVIMIKYIKNKYEETIITHRVTYFTFHFL